MTVLQEIEKEEPGPFQSNARRRDRKRDQKQSAEKKEMDPEGSSKESKADDTDSLTNPKEGGGANGGQSSSRVLLG